MIFCDSIEILEILFHKKCNHIWCNVFMLFLNSDQLAVDKRFENYEAIILRLFCRDKYSSVFLLESIVSDTDLCTSLTRISWKITLMNPSKFRLWKSFFHMLQSITNIWSFPSILICQNADSSNQLNSSEIKAYDTRWSRLNAPIQIKWWSDIFSRTQKNHFISPFKHMQLLVFIYLFYKNNIWNGCEGSPSMSMAVECFEPFGMENERIPMVC